MCIFNYILLLMMYQFILLSAAYLSSIFLILTHESTNLKTSANLMGMELYPHCCFNLYFDSYSKVRYLVMGLIAISSFFERDDLPLNIFSTFLLDCLLFPF